MWCTVRDKSFCNKTCKGRYCEQWSDQAVVRDSSMPLRATRSKLLLGAMLLAQVPDVQGAWVRPLGHATPYIRARALALALAACRTSTSHQHTPPVGSLLHCCPGLGWLQLSWLQAVMFLAPLLWCRGAPMHWGHVWQPGDCATWVAGGVARGGVCEHTTHSCYCWVGGAYLDFRADGVGDAVLC